MGLFGKRKARKAAEAKAEAAQSGKWDNPTQTKKPAYKQKGFNAGKGTNRNGSGPNKSGDDNYTPPARKTTEKREPSKVVSLETKKPKAINTDTETPKLKPRTDTKPKENAAMFRARKKAELDAAKRAQVAKQKKVTKDKDTAKASKTYKQGEQLGTKKGTTKPKSTTVTSDDKKGQKAIADNKSRVTSNMKNKKSAKSGETYTIKDKSGKTREMTKP